MHQHVDFIKLLLQTCGYLHFTLLPQTERPCPRAAHLLYREALLGVPNLLAVCVVWPQGMHFLLAGSYYVMAFSLVAVT